MRILIITSSATYVFSAVALLSVGSIASAQNKPTQARQDGALIEGSATSYDGDTIYMKVRPWGYDAPELSPKRKCGSVNPAQKAKEALQKLMRNGKTVTCIPRGARDEDNRIVATCSVDGVDVGDHLVALGWARDWPKYSDGRYCAKEREARAAKRGIWGLAGCPGNLWSDRDYTNPQTKLACE
jgi:endonuclease YncB( thermonuclease family)